MVSPVCRGSGMVTTKVVSATGYWVDVGMTGAGVELVEPKPSNRENVHACPAKTKTIAADTQRRNGMDKFFILFLFSSTCQFLFPFLP